MQVGFIGLGRMGQGMAGRILHGGHDLAVYNRTSEKAADLVARGARLAESIAEACEGRDVVVTMVANDAVLEDVALGPGGIRDALPRGAVHVTMGTHGVPIVQALSAAHSDAGQVLVAAPAMVADAARVAQPGNTDAVTEAEARAARTDCVDGPDDLVSRHERHAHGREVAFDHVEVGPAEATDLHADTHLTVDR